MDNHWEGYWEGNSSQNQDYLDTFDYKNDIIKLGIKKNISFAKKHDLSLSVEYGWIHTNLDQNLLDSDPESFYDNQNGFIRSVGYQYQFLPRFYISIFLNSYDLEVYNDNDFSASFTYQF